MKTEEDKKRSRREFLLASTAISGGLLMASLFNPLKSIAETKPGDTSGKKSQNTPDGNSSIKKKD